jgi:hypothetical protein
LRAKSRSSRLARDQSTRDLVQKKIFFEGIAAFEVDSPIIARGPILIFHIELTRVEV